MIRLTRLEKKSLVVLAAILLLALGINTGVLTYVASDKFRDSVLAKAVTLNESMIADIGKALNLGVSLEYMSDVEDRLRLLASDDKSYAFGFVADEEGKILFHSDEKLKGTPSEIPVKTLNPRQPQIKKKAKTYEIALPLLNPSGEAVGAFVLGLKSEAVDGHTYYLLRWALGISLFCFVVFILFVYAAISKVITKPILNMQGIASQISSGDLTKKVNVAGNDEIADLGKAINDMAENLKNMISKIRNITTGVSTVVAEITESSRKVLNVADTQQKAVSETAPAIEDMNKSMTSVSQSAEILSDSAGDASSALSEMTASISNVAESSDGFNRTAQDGASATEELIASIREIASSLEGLTVSADETASGLLEVNASIKEIQSSADESVKLAEKVSSDASERGISAISAAINGMREIMGGMDALTQVINRLGEKSEAIGRIVSVIDEVADQTSLLSLNAAILAAQAGQHGAAFAVVADEIKGLAGRTSVSTKEIAELINSVQAETRSSVEMAQEGMSAVRKGVGLVEEVNVALKGIHSSSQVATEMSRAIQRATIEEATVIRQITGAIKEMTDQLKHISNATQEQAKGSQLVLEATEMVKEGSVQIKRATGEQMEVGKQIAAMSEKVRNQSAYIAGAIGNQKDKSNEILQSAELIKATSKDLVEASTGMQQAIVALKEDANKLFEEIQKFTV